MTRAREFGLILLTAAIILFAGQNLSSVEVVFLFWRFQVAVSLIALVPLLIGLIAGTAGTAIALKRRRRGAQPEFVQGESPSGAAELAAGVEGEREITS
jgi:hypothetical protein